MVALGTKACVPAALVADAMLVPATCSGADGAVSGAGVFVVDPDAPGVTLTPPDDHHRACPRRSSSWRRGRRRPTASSVTAPTAPRRSSSITEHATTALCILEAGACAVGPRADGGVHEDPRAVRQAHRHLPGRRPACRRRLRRHRGHPAHRLAGGLAPGGRAPGHRRGRRGQVLGRRGRPARRPRRLAPPRRRRGRPRLPACTATSC